MALPPSGRISLGDVNVELNKSATAQTSLGASDVRQLFEVASGEISLTDGYGKANEFPFTISSNQTNANLRSLALAAGWNGVSRVIATISSGVYISATSTSGSALTVDGSFPNGVELINNGFIIGMGGAGGAGAGIDRSSNTNVLRPGSAGGAGGTALSVSVALSVNNAGTIGGGGGGGGGGAGGNRSGSSYALAGGGGGGGRSSLAANSSGGLGGLATPSPNTPQSEQRASSGGVGTVSGSGGGGAGTVPVPVSNESGGVGGSGGGWGSAGGSGGVLQPTIGTPVAVAGPYSGGAAGNSVVGNSNITWIATGTRLGPIV